MPIRKLPSLLVSQIAAGEVIERPASVVKELIENSLDAGAARIDIQIEEGGLRLIRVSDDGCGILAGDLPLAAAPHATSKISGPEDLAAIATLGFRGEALASIASVSRLTLCSRPRIEGSPAEAGARIQASGDQVSPVEPLAMAPGTVVEVRDLFFNTPARRKFLRSASSEFGHISEVVSRIAMVWPQVAFTLTHNGRTVLELVPSAPSQRLLEILGPELRESLLEFESEQLLDQQYLASSSAMAFQPAGPRIRVWGLTGLPAIARPTARFQYLFVNARPIRDRNLSHAVREAYRGLIAAELQPLVVVMIDLPHHQVDVNVHPAKAEVRFRDPGRVHGLVLSAIRQRLLGADLTPTIPPPARPASRLISPEEERPSFSLLPAAPPVLSSRSPEDSTPQATRRWLDSFVEYFRSMAPQQKGLVFQEVKKALAEDDPQMLEFASQETSPPAAPVPALKPISILQIHDSYLVTQDEQGLLIIDQHALHERVLFEELRQRLLGSETGAPARLESQRLLMPAVTKLSLLRMNLAEELRPLLGRLGIEIEPIGPDAIGIHAFPTLLFDRGVDPADLLNSLLDMAEDGKLFPEPAPTALQPTELSSNSPGSEPSSSSKLVSQAALEKVLGLMACKAAVKAGDRLSEQELQQLLARRQQIERSSACPHGRPTSIRLTLRDLQKYFNRT